MPSSETPGNDVGDAGDAVAEAYYGRRFDRATQRACQERIHWICSQVRGEYVLDVGCSQGIVCLLLAREGVRCVGVDTVAQAIAYAQTEAAKEPPEVRARLDFRQADGARLDFPDRSFDTVILGEVIEHLVQPERVLAEAVRVLKPGGRLIVTTPLGVMPDPDHKQTFWFSTFLPLLESFVRTETCWAITGSMHYIGYVGTAQPAAPSALEARDTVLGLLHDTEQASNARQQEAEQWLSDARERYAQAQDRHAREHEQRRRYYQGVWRLHHAERARLEGDLQAQRKAAQNALNALQEARDELGIVTNSRGWKLLGRVRRFRREFLGGSWRVRAAYLRDITRKLLGQAQPWTPPPPLSPQRLETAVDNFLKRAAQHDGEWFVVMFCATHYIQERRGNRPMRMARLMAQRGIPVLYYYEGLPEGPTPPPVHDFICQCPIGLGFDHMDKIARADLGEKHRLFIISFPYPECARRVEELASLGWTTVYECRDEWEEFDKAGLFRVWYGYGKAAEQYLTARADVTCAVSRPLQEKLQGCGGSRPVHLSPNAYDTAFLSPENAGRLAPRTGPKVLGYFGHLTPVWFDWDAVLEMARRRPDWQFELIGDHEPPNLVPPKNVRLLGLRTHAEINRIAQRWRTAIIPFKINALTAGVDPIKIYEYLALGLPTVSFLMPQIEDYPYTFTVDSVDEFMARAQQAMSMPLDREVIDRFLGVNRWEDRLEEILAWARAARAKSDPLRGLAAHGRSQ